MLGMCYSRTQRTFSEAFKYCKLSADRGYIEAQAYLSEYYSMGIGVEVSAKDSFKYCKLAADKGHSLAKAQLGICYLEGRELTNEKKELSNI